MTTGKIDFVNMPYYFDHYIAGCRSYYSKNAKNDSIISSILHGDSMVVVSQLDPLALRNFFIINVFLSFSLSLLLPRVIAPIFVFLFIFLYSLFLVVWRPKLCSDIITLLLRLLLLAPPPTTTLRRKK